MPNSQPPLDEAAIRKLLPHQGDMCLIDGLSQWSPDQAICQSSAHLRPSHPLSDEDRLGSATLIEVAAQAMALHGALLAGAGANDPNQTSTAPDKHGVLAGVRKVTLDGANIATVSSPLSIKVMLTSGDANTALYEFAVSAGDLSLATGRATVLFASAP